MRTRSALAPYANEDLQPYMLSARQSVEAELKNLLSSTDAGLHPLLEYALLSEGKRLRPILVLLSAQSVGGDPHRVMRLALSFELMHTATLVHDDIIDRDTSRRGLKTLYSKWSVNGAILAGDALIALSVKLATDFGPRIMGILSDVGLELCEGEYMDATFSLESATEEEYFAKIKKKSASLFRGAACCGGLAAQGRPSEVKALSDFGECFGMAYQLNDDMQDLLDRSQVSQDLKNGNVTLPLIHAYERGDANVRRLLQTNFGSMRITPTTAKKIVSKIEETETFSYCRRKIAEYSGKSLTSLEGVRASVFKKYLVQLSSIVDGLKG